MRRWLTTVFVILSACVACQQVSCVPDDPSALLTPQTRWGGVITTALLYRLGNFIERDWLAVGEQAQPSCESVLLGQ
jgi:hypothetical protein